MLKKTFLLACLCALMAMADTIQQVSGIVVDADSGTAEEKVILFHGIYLTLHIVLFRKVRNCHPEIGQVYLRSIRL